MSRFAEANAAKVKRSASVPWAENAVRVGLARAFSIPGASCG